MTAMAKLKEDIQRINFEVPIEYSNAKALKEAAKTLPDWDAKTRESKTFNIGWERIIAKIKTGEILTPRELSKAILYFDLVPSNLVEKLQYIVIANEKSGTLEPIVSKLNRNFSSILPIKMFLEIDVMEEFNGKNFLSGLNRFKTDIVQDGWEGLLKGIVNSQLSFSETLSEFSTNNESYETSMVSLAKGIVEFDKDVRKFETCGIEIAEFLYSKEESKDYISEKFDFYLGLFLLQDESWEGKVISDDYAPVKLLRLYFDKLGHVYDSLPVNLKRVFDQRKNLEKAIELLNQQEPDRGNFWKKYMPAANRVIPKRGRSEVAVAFFFGDIVIVEFAPSGNAAYVYKRDVFEKNLLNSRTALGWKSKTYTHTIRNFTRTDGTLHHVQGWQGKFSVALNALIRKN